MPGPLTISREELLDALIEYLRKKKVPLANYDINSAKAEFLHGDIKFFLSYMDKIVIPENPLNGRKKL